MARLTCLALAIACLALAVGAEAAPPTLEAAREAVRRDDIDTVETVLVDLVVDGRPDHPTLLEAAYLAQEIEAPTATSKVRDLSTALTEQADPPPAARVARGYAALATAIWYWRQKMQGSSIPLLFNEALSAGRVRSGDAATDDLAALLEARTHAAQGSHDEALAVLAARRAEGATSSWTPLLALSEARLAYDRGAAVAPGADGRPTAEAQADFEQAVALFAAHADALPRLVMRPAKRTELATRRAWALHRLGRVDEAAEAYRRVYALGGEARALAVRGLASLFTYEPDRYRTTLAELGRGAGGQGDVALEALTDAWLAENRLGSALEAAEARRALAPDDPAGWRLVAKVFEAMDQPEEAIRHLEEALRRDPNDRAAVIRFDAVARSVVEDDPERTIAWYERLVAVCPDDPFLWNNLGFLLREQVSPHTVLGEGGQQKLTAEAPDRVHAQLLRCVEAYERAVALVDPAEDGLREIEQDWNLATVVNDLGLMLHYFVDVQDGPRAEALYLRALAMTEDGYKDSYVPNLQRLYRDILTGHELAWYRAAVRAAEGLLQEVPRDDGGFDLVPDDVKRAVAAADAKRLRARILQELGAPTPDADADASDADVHATDR
ncbi:MAG: tetratricopeptide repeat protein [Planctomycetota bacterium]